MLLSVDVIVNMGLAVETMEGNACAGCCLGGVIVVPRGDAGERHTGHHLAGVVPLDEVRHSGRKAVGSDFLYIEDQFAVLDGRIGEGIDLYIVPTER